MDRLTLYTAIFGVALLIALFTTLYVVRYDGGGVATSVSDLIPRGTLSPAGAPGERVSTITTRP